MNADTTSVMTAYLASIIEEVEKTQEGSVVSPFEFLQALGTLFKDEKPWNGEEPQDARGFIEWLMTRLQEEEGGIDIDSHKVPVKKLFEVEMAKKVSNTCDGLLSKRQLTSV